MKLKLVQLQVWEYSKFERVVAAVPLLLIHVVLMEMESWCRLSSQMFESEIESKMMAYRRPLSLHQESPVAAVAWCLHHLLPPVASLHPRTMIPTDSQSCEYRCKYLDHPLELDQYSASSSCLK